MNKASQKFLFELLDTPSPTGFEMPGQRVWAKHVKKFSTKVENDLMLVVEDNGIGFDPEDGRSQNGVGMKSLESRVKYLKGNLDIASSENGTCVTVQVPI